jgi:hypothetical protein
MIRDDRKAWYSYAFDPKSGRLFRIVSRNRVCSSCVILLFKGFLPETAKEVNELEERERKRNSEISIDSSFIPDPRVQATALPKLNYKKF